MNLNLHHHYGKGRVHRRVLSEKEGSGRIAQSTARSKYHPQLTKMSFDELLDIPAEVPFVCPQDTTGSERAFGLFWEKT